MPSEAQHRRQYEHNKELLNIPDFCIQSTNYIDWVVTILFYAAVHVVEMDLARLPYHSLNHEERERAMARRASCKRILKEYHALYMASRKARYDCHNYTPQDAIVFQNHLARIEKNFGLVS